MSKIISHVVSAEGKHGERIATNFSDCSFGRGSFFRPQPDDAGLSERLARMEVHPTGPLYGRGNPVVSEDVLALEQRMAEASDGMVAALEASGLEAQRRALRLQAAELEWDWLEDNILQLRFTLASGAFATSILRELLQLRGSESAALPEE